MTPSRTNPEPLQSDKLRLIQVGLGGWGRDWLRTIVRGHPDVRAVAQVDASPQALELTVNEGADPVSCFASLPEALAAVEAEAVLVTANAPAHAPVALAALEAGLPVLVEKPFAPTLQAALEVVRVARERNLTLMVSQNYRFHPAPQRAAELVQEGRLGDVGYVEVDFRRDNARLNPPATRHHQLPDPLLMDMSIHHFDLMRFVLGQDPVSIDCQAFNPSWSPFRDPASAVATVEFSGGAVVSYRGSWASSGPLTPWSGLWRMDFAQGELSWTSRESDGLPQADYLDLRPLKGEPERLPLPDVPLIDRAGSLAAFARAVRSGETPPSSGQDNLQSLALTLAAVRSAREGRRVTIQEELLT